MKIPVPDDVREALEDSQRQMHQMNAALARMERLLVEIRDALVGVSV